MMFDIEGAMEKNDRRIARTQVAIKSAMIELILEKHYDEITVQNIIDRANVGRSTFYAHYRDKEDLFRRDWEGMLDFFTAPINRESLEEGRLVQVSALFQHVKDFHHLYRALVRSGKADRLFATGQGHLAGRIEGKLNLLFADAPGLPETAPPPIPETAPRSIPPSLLAHMLAAEVFTLLRWWLDRNMPHTPQRLDEIFHQFVLPGFRAAINDRPPLAGVETRTK